MKNDAGEISNKVIKRATIFMLLLIIIVPFVLEFLIFRNEFYSVISNSDWSSFSGSFLGGIIGGLGTLIAVTVTTKHTSEIQYENNLNNEINRRKIFTDDIARLIAEYVTDISAYFYDAKSKEYYISQVRNISSKLDNYRNDLKNIYAKKTSITEDPEDRSHAIDDINKKISEAEKYLHEVMLKKESIIVDRSKAIECFFLLKIKLNNINEAVILQDLIKEIHANSGNINLDVNWMGENAEMLTKETTIFINKYIKY